MDEKEELRRAVEEFADAMKARLMLKYGQGYRGWDHNDIHEHGIPARLFHRTAEVYAILKFDYTHIEKTMAKKILVDIANFAMMLWRKL